MKGDDMDDVRNFFLGVLVACPVGLVVWLVAAWLVVMR